MAALRYRGRNVNEEDIVYIRELIAAHPGASRRTLSTKLCEAWQWRQANGALRDMVCRGLLLMLDRAGRITLPPIDYVRHNPLAHRARPAPALIDATPIDGRFRDLQPLEFQPVRRSADEPLFNSLMEQHHYLGYEQPVGEHLKYLVDPERFRGTCYRAANWALLGRTSGRGKQSNSYVPNRSIKDVLGYPLTPKFRELLGQL
jgi:hypothetical protein